MVFPAPERPFRRITGNDCLRNLHRSRIGAVMMTETVLLGVFVAKARNFNRDLLSAQCYVLAHASGGARTQGAEFFGADYCAGH